MEMDSSSTTSQVLSIYLAEKTTNSLYNLVLRMAEVRWPAGRALWTSKSNKSL